MNHPPAAEPSALPASGGLHPLDRPIWNALGSTHARFALGDGVARRYPPEVALFAACVDDAPASLEALGRLATPGSPIALVQANEAVPSGPYETVIARVIDQMLGQALPPSPPRADLELLGPGDVPEMMALVELTKPGPFGPRTREMGKYLGVRDGGRLVALAGERMKLDGFTELSAVCTHPDHRGRGHARALITALVHEVCARGERPFLHVVGENAAAIALYRELGFTLRSTMHFTVLKTLA